MHMNDLQPERIIAIHHELVAPAGGDLRIISEANLYQLVFQANLVGDTISRAAFVFYTLIAYPAFREGNRVTAAKLAERILAEDNYSMDPADREEFSRLEAGINAVTAEPEDIEAWFRAHERQQA